MFCFVLTETPQFLKNKRVSMVAFTIPIKSYDIFGSLVICSNNLCSLLEIITLETFVLQRRLNCEQKEQL